MAKKKAPKITEEMKLLRQIADLLEPIAHASLIKGFKKFQGRIDLKQVAELVRRRDLDALDKLIEWDKFPDDLKELSTITRKGIELTAKEYVPFFKQSIGNLIPGVSPHAFSFNPNMGSVSAVINRNVANLVVEVTSSTKIAIREAIRVGLNEGLPPMETAKIIKRSVGLTSSQSRAVVNLTTTLIDEKFGKLTKFQRKELFGNMGEEAISKKIEEKGIEKIVREYADKQLDSRALNIARTETFRAVNSGQLQIWNQAVEAGLMVASEVEKEWIVTPDELTCPICRPFHTKRAPLDGVFPVGIIGVGLTSPPAHPRCRCHIVLAFKRTQ